jgi:hypothetical protein
MMVRLRERLEARGGILVLPLGDDPLCSELRAAHLGEVFGLANSRQPDAV